MGAETRTVGGGPAVPLGEEWVSLLRSLITGQAPTAVTGDINRYNQLNELAQRGGMTGIQARQLLQREFAGGAPTSRSPTGQTSGIMSGINRLLSGVDLTGTGEAIESIIQRDVGRGAADLRARFGASGGMSLGTPGAVAESLFRAEAVPRSALALGQLNLQKFGVENQSLTQLLQLIAQAAGLGIPQAGTVVQPDAFSQLMGFLPGAAQGTGSIIQGINT